MLLPVDVVRIGLSLRALRRRRGWTQAQLGMRIGRSRTVVSRIERGGAASLTVRALDEIAPRPWSVDKDVPHLLDVKETQLAGMYWVKGHQRQIAEFIVAAVNAHRERSEKVQPIADLLARILDYADGRASSDSLTQLDFHKVAKWIDDLEQRHYHERFPGTRTIEQPAPDAPVGEADIDRLRRQEHAAP